jgi:hypothetical protein
MEWEMTTFFANGKRGSIAAILCSEYADGRTIISAETEAITKAQLEHALALNYPEHYIAAITQDRFYWHGQLYRNE